MATIHQLHGDTSLLTLGASGDAVTQLQKDLNALRVTYIPVIVNGVYDNDTANAVKAFQQKAGLPLSGSVDVDTRAKLTEALQAMQSEGAGTSSALTPSPAIATRPVPAKLPLWQAGLMALGGIALVGGLLWAVTKGEEGPSEEEEDEGSGDEEERAEGTVSGHVKELKTSTKVKTVKPSKCARTPNHNEGESVIA